MTAGVRLPLFFKAPQIAKSSRVLGDWRLTIATGKFSGDKGCRLEDRKHHIASANGALGFRFGRHVNTLRAWVSIDGAEPTRWQDMLPELTRLGVPMDGSSLDNPTDSTVWIPERRLAEANRVAIQPDERKRPVTFHLHGFAGLRDMAREMGCAPEARFVR